MRTGRYPVGVGKLQDGQSLDIKQEYMQLTVIYALFATFHSQDKSRYDLATAKEQ